MSVCVCVCGAGDLHMAGTSTRENGLKETITLKWCTPRTNSVGKQSVDVPPRKWPQSLRSCDL